MPNRILFIMSLLKHGAKCNLYPKWKLLGVVCSQSPQPLRYRRLRPFYMYSDASFDGFRCHFGARTTRRVYPLHRLYPPHLRQLAVLYAPRTRSWQQGLDGQKSPRFPVVHPRLQPLSDPRITMRVSNTCWKSLRRSNTRSSTVKPLPTVLSTLSTDQGQ